MAVRGTQSPLEQSLQQLLDRRRANSTLRNLTIGDNASIDFSSNDFLSLSTSPLLKEAFREELKRSNVPMGSGGSRLLDGNSRYAEKLEQEIADFHGAPAGLLFNSGFDANAGVFACLPQPGDIIIYDQLIHASVHDGMRLSRASQRLPFLHNSVQSLREVLHECVERNKKLRDGDAHVFIAVESVYSMDGDVAPLKSIVDTVEEVLPMGTGYVIVDEAHSTGVLGPKGRGLVSQLGLESKILIRLHTFGKALACNGAIVLCSPVVRHYLINYARPLIYTTFLSYPSLAAIRASYSLLRRGDTEPLASRLAHLIKSLYHQLQSLRFPVNATFAVNAPLQIPAECPKSPIFSLQTVNAKVLASFLQARGFVVRAIVPPTVPINSSRVRICLHAGNTETDIEALVKNMEAWIYEQQVAVSETIEQENATVKAKL